MASHRKALLLGLAAVVVGTVQVATTLAGVVRTHLLTVIARLYFCGSLHVVAALVLVNLWRDHKNNP